MLIDQKLPPNSNRVLLIWPQKFETCNLANLISHCFDFILIFMFNELFNSGIYTKGRSTKYFEPTQRILADKILLNSTSPPNPFPLSGPHSCAVRNTAMVWTFFPVSKIEFQSQGRECISCVDSCKTLLTRIIQQYAVVQHCFYSNLFILCAKNCHAAETATERCNNIKKLNFSKAAGLQSATLP